MTTHIYVPTVPEIAAIFEEESTALGASSVDCVQDETRLFARAVCGPAELVAVGDEVRGGVALRVDGPDVFLHPYLLRKVCVNGAIMPIFAGTTRLERIQTEEVVGAAAFTGGFTSELREAIRVCGSGPACSNAVVHLRAMTEMEAGVAMSMFMYLIHAPGLSHSVLVTVLQRFSSTADMSAFGLVNAVTSVARDSEDPQVRWELEAVGGKLVAQAPALVRPHPRPAEALVGA